MVYTKRELGDMTQEKDRPDTSKTFTLSGKNYAGKGGIMALVVIGLLLLLRGRG